MSHLLTSIFVCSIAFWTGSIVFQSFVVAPVVFQNLAQRQAGRVLRGLFPRFFVLGLICGLAALLAVSGQGVLIGWSNVDLTVIGTLLAMMAAQIYALALVPRINAARDAGAQARKQFKRLHSISVVLTLAVLLAGIFLLTRLSSGSTVLGNF